jgi:ABC-type multidrug transport system fused ATPase/permease subunit
MQFMMLFIILPRVRVSCVRVQEVMDTTPAISHNFKQNISHIDSIEFKNVEFKYQEDSKKPILSKVDFKINKGETAAFLGLTGSGKSTIVNLLMRFYDPNKGEVLINNIPLTDINLKFRKRIGYVSQKTFLYNATIKENIG